MSLTEIEREEAKPENSSFAVHRCACMRCVISSHIRRFQERLRRRAAGCVWKHVERGGGAAGAGLPLREETVTLLTAAPEESYTLLAVARHVRGVRNGEMGQSGIKERGGEGARGRAGARVWRKRGS